MHIHWSTWDFLYYGEANIYQENLDTFLNIAEEFQLKGLNGTADGGNAPKKSYNTTVPSIATHRENDTFETEISSQTDSFTSQTNSEDQIPLGFGLCL